MKIKRYRVDKEKEVVLFFDKKTRSYIHEDKTEIGLPPFERCIEVPWLKDKVSQIAIDGMKLIDFGCNKAEYIFDIKKKYNLKTYGIDAKPQGSKYVDYFFKGSYNDKMEKDVIKEGIYDIATSISSVEHSGNKWNPDEKRISDYQKYICKTLIDNSLYFFLSAPFGKRPGWADDLSRKNFYQFDNSFADDIKSMADNTEKHYLEEIYKLKNGFWCKSDRDESKDCIYRDRKQGANAIILISIWK